MKSYLVLGVGLMVAAAAACGGSTNNGGLTSTSTSGTDAGDGTGTDTDAGGTSSGGTDTTNYDTPTVCTSATTWTRGDQGSSRMHPGKACVSCHDQNNGPGYPVAGTVYPTAHEPDDCNGVNGTTEGLSVVLVDKNNKTITMPVNSVGNFYAVTSVAFPYAAKVVSTSGKERAMVQHQTSGDCNSCHTVDGTNSAPGRIMAP